LSTTTFGLPTVTDILSELEKPGRDPRPAFKAAVFMEVATGNGVTDHGQNGSASCVALLRPRFKRHYLSARAALKSRRYTLAHLVAEGAHRIVGTVDVAAGHRKVPVPQQVAHLEGVRAAAHPK
jgi:hypothetical protein